MEALAQQFIIDTVLIDPITKIITQIENGEMRDCDIKWLDSKLEKFIAFAAETLGMKITLGSDIHEKFNHMNEYVKGYYVGKLTTLLNYFKSL